MPPEDSAVDAARAALAASEAADAARANARAEEADRRANAADSRAAAAEKTVAEAAERLRLEETRLEKLWDAYKAQENDLRLALERAGRLERELRGKDQTASESERLLRERETEIGKLRDDLDEERRKTAALEIARAELADAEKLRVRAEELEALLGAEKERLAKLYVVYEELEAERDDLARRMDEKDVLLRRYESAFKDIVQKKG